jgi:hypothetical protein
MRLPLLSQSILGVLLVAGCGLDGGPSPTPVSVPPAPSSAPTPSAAPTPEPSTAVDASGTIDPANFVATIDNPWYPLLPGTTFHYRGTTGGEPTTDTYEVTTETKVVAGVTTTVIRDTVRVRGVVSERTEDWFAQDVDGNVWYFGEATAELNRKGKVLNTHGSWEAGVDGAEPGIFMPAEPAVGESFAQEHFPGEAEDWFVVMFTGTRVTVPAGTYKDALVTGEWTPLEPGVVGEKTYVQGVGQVMERDISGGDETLRLVRVTGP